MAVKLARVARSGSASRGPKAGDLIAGKYRIERVIGEGGMGTVYSAHHQLLDQRVALKLLFDEASEDKEAAQRFLLEARAAARLQSEHVTRVMDIDTLENGLPFIVMEYLEGADLAAILDARGPMPPEAVADYMLQGLQAIAQAHAQGIIHRDLKPSNLFLATTPDGSTIIKILDFGISKSTFSSGKVSSLTSSRSVLGSPPYMSPEQIRRPRTVDMRTDIWSLGICMYELLTGNMPFVAEEVGELFAAILEQEPRSVRAFRDDVPEGMNKIVMRCLARNRDNRFPDVGELARALSPFGSGMWAKSPEKIAQTLARGEEMSSPRRRAPVVVSAAEGRVQTVDTLLERSGESQATELSPTASTVGRGRFTRFPEAAVKRAAWAMGGVALCAAMLLLVLIIGANPPQPHGSSLAAAPPVVDPVVLQAPAAAPVQPAPPAAADINTGTIGASAVPQGSPIALPTAVAQATIPTAPNMFVPVAPPPRVAGPRPKVVRSTAPPKAAPTTVAPTAPPPAPVIQDKEVDALIKLGGHK